MLSIEDRMYTEGQISVRLMERENLQLAIIQLKSRLEFIDAQIAKLERRIQDDNQRRGQHLTLVLH